ncbi:hypothetical protein L198_00376 [Cryptococcus wingfieldii CBS 7118]|uniref:Thioester reductase (TE) domain-containing protein n=1 Tax=Cryptococcus wingfieldii CBS 7118 TaxID=1295528 RepID=A0A1E3K642_9TREE|nr:hypothetical protein L198_00376 [Cryptococcus wingfieldii CBS 7118]ODO08644.1 hypothetical protein L198_00376 [Cryptococcus wingfieldii CBS 7118]
MAATVKNNRKQTSPIDRPRRLSTVRSEDKNAKDNELFALKKYAADGSLQVFVIPDLVNADWDWDTPLLKDVNAIAHVASPFDLPLPTYEHFAAPVIAGTRNLLQDASKNPNIKSVNVVDRTLEDTVQGTIDTLERLGVLIEFLLLYLLSPG